MSKHHKMRVSAPTLVAGATVGVVTSVMVFVTTQPQSIVDIAVEPAALVIHGSSTNPTGEGIEDFYGGFFNPDRTEIERVNFFFGPLGIAQAIRTTEEPDDVVVTSGWGAANASFLMTTLNTLNPDDPDLTGTTWILNDNVSRPNGGYGTRYPPFALVGVNPLPTPSDVDAPILDVGYQYNVNSNAPAYPLNVAALANSFAAWFDDRVNQKDSALPPEALADMDGTDTDPDQHYHFVVDPDGDVVKTPVDGNVTYVTYTKDGLPLVAPLRMLPGGDVLADGLEPVLTVAVNAGYPENDPLSDPSVYRPARIVPPPAQLVAAAQQVPGALEDGLSNIQGPLSGDASNTNRSRSDAPKPKAPLTNVWRVSPKSSPGASADDTASRPRGGPVRDAIRSTVENVTKTVTSALNGVGRNSGDSSDDPGQAVG